MPTEVIHSIRASGGDYTTLTAWEAAQQRDLVAVDQVAVAELYDDWPGGLSDHLAAGANWTTSASQRLVIRAAAGQGHDGDINTGVLIAGDSASGTFDISVDIKIEGLRVNDSVVAPGLDGIFKFRYLGTAEYAHVERCIVMSAGTSYGVVAANRSVSNVIVSNSLLLGCKWGVYGISSSSDVAVQNCTIANSTQYGARRGVYTNTVVYGSAALDYYQTIGLANCASSDTTGSVGLQNIDSSEFVDYAADDFHLASASGLIGAGVDLTALGVTTDIDGDARVVPFDIGFDQRVISVGAALQSDAGSASIAAGDLTSEIKFSGAIVGQSVAVASLSTGVGLNAVAQSAASAIAYITTSINLSAAPASQAHLFAALTIQSAGLSASVSAIASMQAALDTGIFISSSVLSQSNASANLSASINFQAAAQSDSSAFGVLFDPLYVMSASVGFTVHAEMRNDTIHAKNRNYTVWG